MNNFKETQLDPNILKAISEMGFKTPTPIQAKTITHLMNSNQDLIASAQTGTGTTAAVGLPILNQINTDSPNVQNLILCPTRELCVQITSDLRNYSKYLNGVDILAVYGGARIEKQIKALKKGPQIVVGTPGRTKDLIKRKKLFVNKINRLILDEADEMLSMGFKEDLESIIHSTSKDKQILLFSATMTKKVNEVKNKYMNNPLDIVAKRTDGELINFSAVIRLDTPVEVDYYNNGGILQTVLRKLAKE